MDRTGESHLKVKLARFRKSNATFSLMWNIDPIQIQAYYIYVEVYIAHVPKSRTSRGDQ
jgi:hypothetical protein